MNTALDLGALRRIDHLNAGTFRPTKQLHLITHVLVCVFEHGIALVDAGFGTADIHERRRRLGHSTTGIKPALNLGETALHQLTRMGLASEVRLVVGTHLDMDHIGGATDFSAPLIVTAAEYDAAHTRRSIREKLRYRPQQLHDLGTRLTAVNTEARRLTELPIGVGGVSLEQSGTLWLVPLPGHTRGHAAVAVRGPGGWLLHAGDAYFDRRSIVDVDPAAPPSRALCGVERFLAMQPKALRANHVMLRNLANDGVQVICSHDPIDLPPP